MSLGRYLSEATSLEAQLALSYLVWPKNAPHPRTVDEWMRRNGAGWLPARAGIHAPFDPQAARVDSSSEVS